MFLNIIFIFQIFAISSLQLFKKTFRELFQKRFATGICFRGGVRARYRGHTRICPAGQKATSVVFSKDWGVPKKSIRKFSKISEKSKIKIFDFSKICFFSWFSIFFRFFDIFDFSQVFDFFRSRKFFVEHFSSRKFFVSRKFSDRIFFRSNIFRNTFFSNPEKYSLPLFLTHSTHCTANLCPCREIRSSDLLVVLNRRRSLWHSLCRLYWV